MCIRDRILSTYEVDNYPGLPGSSGFDLGMKFREHAEQLLSLIHIYMCIRDRHGIVEGKAL